VWTTARRKKARGAGGARRYGSVTGGERQARMALAPGHSGEPRQRGGGETMAEKPPVRRETMHCDATMAWLETALRLRSGPRLVLPGVKPATAQQQGIMRQQRREPSD